MYACTHVVSKWRKNCADVRDTYSLGPRICVHSFSVRVTRPGQCMSDEINWREIAMATYPGYPIVGSKGPFIAYDKATGCLLLSDFRLELVQYGKVGQLQLPAPRPRARQIHLRD